MAQTAAEKAAEKDAKLEQEHVEAQVKADEEQAQKAAASRSASETEAKAVLDLKQQITDEILEDIRKRATEGDVEGFGGQALGSDHFTIATTDSLGRASLEVKPAGWVGTGFEVPASRISELIALLGKVKNLPEQDENTSK